ncbi:MAG: response regulator [Ardenticatenaceae bacterium]|nr:response regulator [Ardenticatenaceae bacterium]HBY99051.1 response regulator [Chloroflexota bacterium]
MNSLRVCIVEDDTLVAMNLRDLLEGLGHTVIAEAHDGIAGVRVAETLRPDLILMDIRMPSMSGIEASREIMARCPAPIVLLTAYSDPELIRQADEAGVQSYLVKPVESAELQPAIVLAVSRFRERAQLEQEAENLRQSLAERKLVERAKGILMRRLNLTEEEAYLRLKREARSRRVKMVTIAERIIQAVELFGDL